MRLAAALLALALAVPAAAQDLTVGMQTGPWTMAPNLVIPIPTFEAVWDGRANRVRFAPRAGKETPAIKAQPAP